MSRRARLALGLAVFTGALVWLAVNRPGSGRSPEHERPVVAASPAPAEAPGPTTPAPRTQTVALKRGDNLISALKRGGIDARTGHDIAHALRQSGADLRRLRPTDTFEITWGLEGEPHSIAWEASPWLGYVVISTEDGWRVERAETRPDVRVEAVQGEVRTSLFQAVEDAGEPAQLTLDLVGIFESEFDFTADTRPGDRFRLLLEKRYAGDTFVDHGRVLAAQYLNDGRLLTGVGFESTRGERFAHYDRQGRSLRKTFLRSPLEFTRITSGFTYARPHPILGGVRPHLAIDYAAPVGTPVRAVADGVVATAGWDGGNGITVRLRHRSGYETMYNHLSRVAAGIHAGVRVRQRQVIGHVGATGLATGPHLDYRVARHGSFVNPLSEKFIPGEPIAAAERAAFLQQARALLERLEREAPF